MYKLQLVQKLNGDHEHCLEGEFPSTNVKEILQTGSKQFHHQGIVLATRTEIVDLGDAFVTTELLVKPETMSNV